MLWHYVEALHCLILLNSFLVSCTADKARRERSVMELGARLSGLDLSW